MQNFQPKQLPPAAELETVLILKRLSEAHRYLAELKGVAHSIPNEAILLDTLTLQEAKDSSEIENIVTTHDEIFRAGLTRASDGDVSPAVKEVQSYAEALRVGFDLVKNSGLLTMNHILEIQSALEKNHAGFRKQMGTALKNARTGEIVYTPPQSPDEIISLMRNLEQYINDNDFSMLDSLIKMAVIHFQFESIHPFYDGNGRTGRIINILYLILQGLLTTPVLYLSRFLVKNKGLYYQKLQNIRDHGDWESWVLFILDAIIATSKDTTDLILKIKDLMLDYKHRLRSELGALYSQDLLNNLFRHPYTKIQFIQEDLGVSRLTATKYLDQLAEKGFIKKEKQGRQNYFINEKLVKLLTQD